MEGGKGSWTEGRAGKVRHGRARCRTPAFGVGCVWRYLRMNHGGAANVGLLYRQKKRRMPGIVAPVFLSSPFLFDEAMPEVWLEVLPWYGLRDPFSALSHLLGAVLSLAAMAALLRRAYARGRCGWALVDLALYGLSMGLVFAASTLFHAVIRPPEAVVFFKKLDHAAIFVMMAGTGTAIYSALPSRRARKAVLIIGLWAVSGVALVVKMWIWPMPLWMTALMYVGVGWAAMLGVFGIVLAAGWRPLRLFLAGAAVFTVGAAVFAARWPVPWPGVVEGHEVFHVLVLVGAGLHFRFIYSHCARPHPFREAALRPALPTGAAARGVGEAQFIRGSSGKVESSA